jgi:hypothetical protein
MRIVRDGEQRRQRVPRVNNRAHDQRTIERCRTHGELIAILEEARADVIDVKRGHMPLGDAQGQPIVASRSRGRRVANCAASKEVRSSPNERKIDVLGSDGVMWPATATCVQPSTLRKLTSKRSFDTAVAKSAR